MRTLEELRRLERAHVDAFYRKMGWPLPEREALSRSAAPEYTYTPRCETVSDAPAVLIGFGGPGTCAAPWGG